MQEKKGGSLLDYGARYYDPKVARWMSTDPLQDQFPDLSPYNYTFNNPLKFTDPTGMAPDTSIVTTLDGVELFRWDDGSTENTIITTLDQITISSENSYDEESLSGTDILGNADAAGTAMTGIGINWKQANRYGNTGDRFRADLFGQKYIRFSGKTGEQLVKGIKVGAPVLSLASAGSTIVSDQPIGWKVADLTSTGVGVFGGHYGAAASLFYGLGFKPLVRPVVSPTDSELRSLHESQFRYSQTNSCRAKRCN